MAINEGQQHLVCDGVFHQDVPVARAVEQADLGLENDMESGKLRGENVTHFGLPRTIVSHFLRFFMALYLITACAAVGTVQEPELTLLTIGDTVVGKSAHLRVTSSPPDTNIDHFILLKAQPVLIDTASPCQEIPLGSFGMVLRYDVANDNLNLNGPWKQRKDNMSISFNGVKGESDLIIHNLKNSDEGCYIADFWDPHKRHTVARLYLKPDVPPRITSKGPTDISVIARDSSTLDCESTGDPRPSTKWMKGQKEIVFDHTTKCKMNANGSLIIPVSLKSHTGSYQCIVTNTAGVATRDFNLMVNEPPTILESMANVTFKETYPVVLACRATGTPTPNITWYKDDKQLTGNEIGVTIKADGSLQLKKARAEDAGRYQCIASNGAGNIMHTMNLEVLPFDGDCNAPSSEFNKQAVIGTVFGCGILLVLLVIGFYYLRRKKYREVELPLEAQSSGWNTEMVCLEGIY